MKKIILLLILLTILLGSSSGFSDQCREILNQQQTEFDVQLPMRNGVIAQSFVAACDRISSIDLYLQIDVGEGIVLELLEDDGTGVPDEKNVLVSVEMRSKENSPQWYKFDIGNIALVPGDRYYIALRRGSQSTSFYSAWALQRNTNTYPHGEIWLYLDRSQKFQVKPDMGDMAFRINCCHAQRELPSGIARGLVLFEKYSLKNSGKYSLSGGYIDQKGDLWEYDHSDEKWQADYLEPQIISGHSLLEKLTDSKQVGTVPYSKLETMLLLVEGAARGDLFYQSVSVDQGTTAYVAYLFDEELGSYEEVVLAKSGDWNVSNNSDEAKQLVEWLSKLWPIRKSRITEYDQVLREKQKRREEEKKKEEERRRKIEQEQEKKKRREEVNRQACEPPVHITAGFVLFERSYVNYAWGYKLSGVYIDQNGDIWEYDHSNEKWNPQRMAGCGISEGNLKDKFRNAKHVGRVDASRLKEMIVLIDGVAKGELVRQFLGADMGSTSYVAYAIDNETGAYRDFTISTHGDWSVTNTSDEAKKLLKWLSAIWPLPPKTGELKKRKMEIKEKILPEPLISKVKSKNTRETEPVMVNKNIPRPEVELKIDELIKIR